MRGSRSRDGRQLLLDPEGASDVGIGLSRPHDLDEFGLGFMQTGYVIPEETEQERLNREEVF